MNKHQLVLWPFDSAILVEERDPNDSEFKHFHLIDQWVYLGLVEDQASLFERGYAAISDRQTHSDSSTLLDSMAERERETASDKVMHAANFDLDVYHILLRFLLKPDQQKLNHLQIHKLTRISKV